ncbi:MAG: RNA polymerase sigma factor [Proteobacteria bacterium]|nr:RNA polymerase sigma factor [Pseudomonadota bacterium]
MLRDITGRQRRKQGKTGAVEIESLNVATLVEQARQGNRGAFQKLVSLFQEDIYRMLYYRTYSRMDAEDLSQEVFVQAYKKINSLKNAERFKSWLYSIAANRFRDFTRKRKLLTFFGLSSSDVLDSLADNSDDSSNRVLEKMEQEKFWHQVKKLLADLSDLEREVFTMRFMDQLKIGEIAIVLQKNESTVKTHLYRALQKMKKQSSTLKEFRESLS